MALALAAPRACTRSAPGVRQSAPPAVHSAQLTRFCDYLAQLARDLVVLAPQLGDALRLLPGPRTRQVPRVSRSKAANKRMARTALTGRARESAL